MSSELPVVSIIIPSRPGQGKILAVEAARQLDYPRDWLEIIVARGQQPAMQRNLAIQAARGEIIYFLDDDAQPLPQNLRRAVRHFEGSEVAMVGGPNLCPKDAPPIEQVFAVVLSSWLAFGPSRARYASVGKARQTSEKELILCNLVARKQALLDLGGFDEALYPNEENALMDDLRKEGRQLLYDPELVVYRRPRPTIKTFFKMLMTYGRGRAEQFRLHPTLGSVLNFVPPLFVLYMCLLPWTNSNAVRLYLLKYFHPETIWLGITFPLLIYILAVVAQAVVSTAQHGIVRAFSAMPFTYFSHMLYGTGFWLGLFTRLKRGRNRRTVEVKLDYPEV